METMFNAHHMWSIQSQLGLLSEKQCGFRKNHNYQSIISPVLKGSSETPLLTKNTSWLYDMTWKHGILADLWNLCFRGHLRVFVQGFLSESSFKVRMGSTVSELHEQEIRVSQVASCLLPYSASRLTTLLTLSWRARIAPCLWTILLCVYGASH